MRPDERNEAPLPESQSSPAPAAEAPKPGKRLAKAPKKKKKTSPAMKWAYRGLMALLVVLIAVCAVKIVEYYSDRQQSIDEFNGLLDQVTQGGTQSDHGGMDADDVLGGKTQNGDGDEEEEEEVVVYRDIAPLFQQNADFLGWIYISGTNVNYPVMYTPNDPQKYLHLSFYGEYSSSGVPFMDYRCTLSSDNLILYGHHMKNGSMFANIVKYQSDEFWAKHKTLEFETADECGIYTVFAAMLVEPDDDWYYFVNAADEADFNAKISAILRRSYIDTDVVPQYGQQIITLSTCYGDDRFIVLAVRTGTKEFRTQAEADAAAAASGES